MATVRTTQIKLTSRESQLRNLLLDVGRYIDESKELKETLVLRFAGGWVRDKLLGIPSHDIDVAINLMTGYPFSQKLNEYLQNPENLEKHSLEEKDIKNVHKIAANPEKSKHLETATTNIFGFEVDLVNLRKETYTTDSRNPKMEFGTAEEDAFRRDAPINALFYNLQSDEVEDFTGGLEDLAAKRIRTPLEPKDTFMDDPLRVLRLIRFASRLDFSIDADTEACMGYTEVMEALKLKISRERVGVEVEKMLKGKDPRRALQLFDRLGLYSTIFTDPTVKTNPTPMTESWKFAYDCLAELSSTDAARSIYQSLVRSEDEEFLSWVLVSLTPWTTVPQTQSEKSKGKPSLPLGASIAREGIKANNKICTLASGAFKHYEQIVKLKNDINRMESYTSQRDTIGMTIRRWDFPCPQGNWRLQVLFSLLVEAMQTSNKKGYGHLFKEWQGFVDHLKRLDLMEVETLKGIMTGNELSAALGAKPGAWMKNALEVTMEWQLRNPDVEDIKGAVDEVRNRAGELKIPIKENS